jgi:hypothetical protein
MRHYYVAEKKIDQDIFTDIQICTTSECGNLAFRMQSVCILVDVPLACV